MKKKEDLDAMGSLEHLLENADQRVYTEIKRLALLTVYSEN
jgi:hypothetical protein